MKQNKPFHSLRLTIAFVALGLLALIAAQWSQPASAAPTAPTAVLSLANVSAPDIKCVFDADCTTIVDDTTSAFTFDLMTGSGFLQSRLWPRGQIGTAGAGLYPYLYRVDMSELVGPGNPACITSLSLDFGPIVPLDYDGNGSLDQVFIVTSGGIGSVAPSSAELTGGQLTFNFSPPVCGDFSPAQDNGESTFFFGLASPFRDQEVTAKATHNWGSDMLELNARAPRFAEEPTLLVVPGNGLAGDVVQLIGSGYTPGGYPGTIRWDGADTGTLAIPSGGAFSEPFTIPASASSGDHTIAVCSLNPCATGEFEQLDSAPFSVTGPALPAFAHQVFLPIVTRPGLAAAEPFTYVIDPSVTPSQAELPGLDGGAPRPLTAVRDPHGTVSTFVANELVVQTDDSAALAGLLAHTGGEILLEIDPADAALSDLAKIYLVRADLSTADLSELTADVTALIDPDVKSAGQFAFADEDGARILELAASEAVGGLTAGINWVSETGSIPVDSSEAPNGPALSGVVYTPDAYDWVHFAQGTTQDIGVPEAWTLMSRAGKLGNRVDLAILDGGFFPNADFPTPMTYLSVIPFITDPRGVSGFDGRAPNHGTDVLQTAVARSDNDLGIVGVAAPVARPIAVFTSYDYVVSIASVIAARAAGAEIMNMSYSANVPAIFAWTVWPFEATTASVRASGALLFASAGNDGQNVDGEDCFLGICWEHTWHTPCENAGVICVGGLRWDSKNRAGNSNYGPESVDIFAPYTVYSGQSPAAPGGDTTAGVINGTSFSSPYAASVAALIWASDPTLNANQVWTIMRDTAHSSPDGRVNRYVNAYQAVLSAIGVGVDVELTAPTSGGTYDKGFPVRLNARVGYVAIADGTPLQVQWRVDGVLVNSMTYTPGAGSHILYPEAYARDLAVGAHTATIRATAGSVVVEKSVPFTIVNTPPVATIDQPSSGAAYCPGELITFRGSAYDINQPFGLPDSAFAWRSNINGNLGTGATLSTSALSAGSHTITLRVTDDGSLWDEDSISLTIRSAADPACVDLAPSALVTSPADGYSVYADAVDGTGWYKTITFSGVVDDTEDPISALDVEWLSDLQGSLGTPAVNPTTGVTTITTKVYAFGSCGSTHHITLRVTDTAGHITSDQITIYVNVLC
ncbi:MAG: S8 family serine peptidase [Ardenticatenaceae bacterium]|nr:S8 family serine peptidase [Ardenticatenaceae bacterium]